MFTLEDPKSFIYSRKTQNIVSIALQAMYGGNYLEVPHDLYLLKIFKKTLGKCQFIAYLRKTFDP